MEFWAFLLGVYRDGTTHAACSAGSDDVEGDAASGSGANGDDASCAAAEDSGHTFCCTFLLLFIGFAIEKWAINWLTDRSGCTYQRF